MADNIYARQMSKLKHGLPLWVPEPTQHDSEVRIGDVGYVQRGAFRRLFNASLPGDHSTHRVMGVPKGFEPLELTEADISTNPKHFDVGALHTASVTKIETELQLTTGAVPASVGIQFHCSNKTGAVLVLKDRAVRQDALCLARFEKYIRTHYESWYDFANERHERGIEMGDIVLVTGCDKTAEWALAAFTEARRDAGVFFQCGLCPLAGGSLSLVGSWESIRSAETRTGPYQPGPRPQLAIAAAAAGGSAISSSLLVDGRKFDQCVFLRALKMRVRRILAPKVIRAASEPRDDSPSSEDSESVRGSPSLEERSTDGDSIEHELEFVPGLNEEYDPLDILLDYMIENSDASLAIARWSDLQKLCPAQEVPDDLASFLNEACPNLHVDEFGVVSIEHAPDPDEQKDENSLLERYMEELLMFEHENITPSRAAPCRSFTDLWPAATHSHSYSPSHKPSSSQVPFTGDNTRHAPSVVRLTRSHAHVTSSHVPYPRHQTSSSSVHTPGSKPSLTVGEKSTAEKRKRSGAAGLIEVLDEMYARTPFPTVVEREAIARQLDMSLQAVKSWFQIKRQSQRFVAPTAHIAETTVSLKVPSSIPRQQQQVDAVTLPSPRLRRSPSASWGASAGSL